MAVPQRDATYFNFTGGLNTEATPISREPNDAVDLSNVVLGLDGSVRRRKGIDFIGALESGAYYVNSSFDYTSVNDGVYADEAPSAVVFTPQREDGTTFSVIVVHVGTDFRIFDYTKITDLVEIETPRQVIDMSGMGEDEQAHYRTAFTSDRNRLYFVNKHLPFGYIHYDSTTNEFDVVLQNLLVRDLSGDANIDDTVNHNGKNYQCIRSHKSFSEFEPGVGEDWQDVWVQLGPELTGDPSWSTTSESASEVTVKTVNNPGTVAEYTSYNSYSCILSHTSSASNKPPNATYWASIQYSSSIPQWESGQSYLDSTLEGPDDYVSNVTKLDNLGHTAAIFAAGRLWISGTISGVNKIFFSQTISEDFHYNRMYQSADPFSDIDSEVVDTDGGSIVVVGAEKIIALEPFQGGVLAFANNGVWYIRGNGGVFRATDFSVDKVSSDGLVGAEAIATVDDKVVYFGHSNVYAVAARDVDILPSTVPISEKVASFYSSIPLPNREAGKAIYNGSNKKLYFFTNFEFIDWDSERNLFNQATHMRDVLVFDTRLTAWYKYSLSEDTTGDKVAFGDVFNLTAGDSEFTTVIDNNGDFVEDNNSALVEAYDAHNIGAEIRTIPVFIKRNGTNTDWAFGTLTGDFFQDFSLNDPDAESYDSFILTAHQVFNDLAHVKQANYITTIFDRVESGTIDETTGEDITPGGCLMSVFYNFATSTASAKYGTARQAYKPTKWSISYFDGSDPGIEVVKNKHKIRGRGDAFQLKFENDGDKDFKLYGFQIGITSSRRV